jgi:hypothetical protein
MCEYMAILMYSLVLFLKYVQFLKPCIQFLIDTILNLAIVQFLMKKKGDTCYGYPALSLITLSNFLKPLSALALL